ncbi:hypothetical protein [Chitinophaga rhizosphaerae]|uniref:hypothetical protein n=1 Tax=Chitinophaga rhizosphaerae TaxID=1864947 RepID=UPI000F7FC65E|nr:hypothetical protein [Chitinophaga rhizosphaerae]
MKYLFTTYSSFFYAAFIACLTYLLMEGEKLNIVVDYEYYTLTTRSGLLYAAMVMGLIWLIYIGQDSFLYSKKLIWLHFGCTLLAVSATCWYHSQGFQGRYVSLNQGGAASRYGGGSGTHQYYVLPYSWLLVLLFIAAQAVYITHVVKGRTSRY